MSIEHLIVLLALVISSIQYLLRRGAKPAIERSDGASAEDDRGEAPAADWQPSPPLPVSTPLSRLRPSPRLASGPRPPVAREPGSVSSTRRREAGPQPPERPHARDVLPRDRAGLRRALLLAVVLGPPRALEDSSGS